MTETNHLVEHFFRHEYANLVSVLSRTFGLTRLDLIEDMVGSAMLQAMNSWKHNGIPDNPTGWIHAVARNRILDVLRREKTTQQALAFAGRLHRQEASSHSDVCEMDECQIADNLLRMMFVCCHPTLDRKSQIAITLKILCGFSVSEIARGLLISREAAKKRIQRAKSHLASQNFYLEIPPLVELPARLDVVHDVLYLLFNEGYSTSHGIESIRDDVCEEAARLCHMLCEHDSLCTPNSRALLSLMLFHAARLEARVDSLGNSVLLEEQDRSKWDRNLIEVAHRWLIDSVKDTPSRFHYEAALAQLHCSADSFAATDWSTIIRLYDRLGELFPSPIYSLNRAIAVAQSGDTDTAIEDLNALRRSGQLDGYFLLECAMGYVRQLQGDIASATDNYLKALSFDLADHQRLQIKKKLNQLTTVNREP